MITDNFAKRHIGPNDEEVEIMLKKIGVSSIDGLIDETVPASIRLKEPLNLPKGLNEYEYLNHIKELASKNKVYKTYIGLGYYNTIVPGVILRNILENPGWYTSYTPYQAEISQGRLEALLDFQTVISDLTGMEISNCSLLDEGTATAEAMFMLWNTRPRAQVKAGANVFFISEDLFPHSIDILATRAVPLGIEIVIGNHETFELNERVFGAIVQYPNQKGKVVDYSDFVVKAHENGTLVAVAADLMSLAVLTPPGEWGADIAVGTSQRFGIPMGYGGPHAGYIATKDSYKRNMPGRIIGASIDANGNRALRMALQTREQHIKREKATSNICTAQALLATMAGFYASWHGQEGIREIATDINKMACIISDEVVKLGYKQLNEYFFDTLEIALPDGVSSADVQKLALEKMMNFRFIDDKTVGISLDETTSKYDLNDILGIFAKANNKEISDVCCCETSIKSIPENLTRTSEYLTHSVFNTYHSETAMERYMKKLENRDIALNRSMIPLGSCTMKLTAATEMLHLSWPEFGNIHPFVPVDQAEGYQIMFKELEKILCEVTGFDAFSFQPNSGAAGEYTGLMVIREYHISRGDAQRNLVLIPASAHGTNPASAVQAGNDLVIVKCDEAGNIDTEDLRTKAVENKDILSSLMITYPSTHGVFEENVLEIMDIIHENGGLVYMDGANMNAQVGLTSPGFIGADVCHLNLHKTFGIPHGGGGPGAGPIGVAKHLTQFLPTHTQVKTGGEKGIHAVAAAPYGSASILPISYAYCKLLGGEGLTDATKYAMLNANYIKSYLEEYYPILYVGSKGRVAHEMIVDINPINRAIHIGAIDIAKRLMDFGIHAPTVAFPVVGTLMVEPTESEPLSEMNRLCEALVQIKKEIDEVVDGKADHENNLLKNAPHTLAMVMGEEWNFPYTRQQAAFPNGMDVDKYWPPVARINDAYGDRNLVCNCEPIENYVEA